MQGREHFVIADNKTVLAVVHEFEDKSMEQLRKSGNKFKNIWA